MGLSIITKFHGPTNARGSRVSAKVSDYGSEMQRASDLPGRIVLPWDHAQGVEGNHYDAARELARQLGWAGPWYAGGGPGDTGYVFVRSTEPAFVIGES